MVWLMNLALGGSGAGNNSFLSMIIMMGVIFAIFYFLVFRPRQKQQSQHEKMIENLEKGDRVITVGGLHGQISSLSDDTVKINVAKDFKITVSRNKIASVKNSDSENQ